MENREEQSVVDKFIERFAKEKEQPGKWMKHRTKWPVTSLEDQVKNFKQGIKNLEKVKANDSPELEEWYLGFGLIAIRGLKDFETEEFQRKVGKDLMDKAGKLMKNPVLKNKIEALDKKWLEKYGVPAGIPSEK